MIDTVIKRNVIMINKTDREGRKGFALSSEDLKKAGKSNVVTIDENSVVLTVDDIRDLLWGKVLVRIMCDGHNKPYFYASYGHPGLAYKNMVNE